MEDNINTILLRQQELEYLKKQDCPSKKLLKELRRQTDSSYSRRILNQCLHIHSQIQLRKFFHMLRKIPIIILALFLVLPLSAPLKRITSQQEFSTPASDSVSEFPIVKVQEAIMNGNYEEARRIIKENNFQPDNFANVISFSRLYIHDKDYDQAADVVINFINNTYGPRNVNEYSLLYKQLDEVSKLELSPETQQRCDTCLKACRESAARLASISALIDTKRYDLALELCDAEHRNGTCYASLFEYYVTCYTKLEKYEDFADLLIEIAEQLQIEGDLTYTLPDRYRVRTCMQDIYSQVSEETRDKIDALNFFTS